MTRQADMERLARRMYDETFDRSEDPDLEGVAKDRVTVLFGPPMLRPDVALVSFQGGAGDKTPSPRTWTERLVYLDDKFKFGQALRAQFQAAGLRETLETRTVAMAACFPEAPVSEAGRWCAKQGPNGESSRPLGSGGCCGRCAPAPCPCSARGRARRWGWTTHGSRSLGATRITIWTMVAPKSRVAPPYSATTRRKATARAGSRSAWERCAALSTRPNARAAPDDNPPRSNSGM